jgi:hypothetical protein
MIGLPRFLGIAILLWIATRSRIGMILQSTAHGVSPLADYSRQDAPLGKLLAHFFLSLLVSLLPQNGIFGQFGTLVSSRRQERRSRGQGIGKNRLDRS